MSMSDEGSYNGNNRSESARSKVLPTDPFEVALRDKLGLPNGAHTQPSVVQAVDFYGNATSFIVQTVKTELGNHAFITMVNAQGSNRFMLPPNVMTLLQRQSDSVTTILRRRHGRRLAEEQKANGRVVGFTPEMRKKAAATRKRNAAKRAARKAARA